MAPGRWTSHESDRRYALSALGRITVGSVWAAVRLPGGATHALAIDRRALPCVGIALRPVVVAAGLARAAPGRGIRPPVLAMRMRRMMAMRAIVHTACVFCPIARPLRA